MGNVMISYNNSKKIVDRFWEWHSYDWDHTYTMRSTGDYMKNQQGRRELLLTNYSCQKEALGVRVKNGICSLYHTRRGVLTNFARGATQALIQGDEVHRDVAIYEINTCHLYLRTVLWRGQVLVRSLKIYEMKSTPHRMCQRIPRRQKNNYMKPINISAPVVYKDTFKFNTSEQIKTADELFEMVDEYDIESALEEGGKSTVDLFNILEPDG